MRAHLRAERERLLRSLEDVDAALAATEKGGDGGSDDDLVVEEEALVASQKVS